MCFIESMGKNAVIKFLIFFIGYLIYPFSFLFPRSKTKWAFGSYRESFNDNAKYLFIAVSKHYSQIDSAWISGSKDTVNMVRKLGLKSYYAGSFRGLWHALRSRYWFFNSYTSDILFFASGGAVCTNLWHGVGLKKIEFSIDHGPLADRYVKRKFKERFYHPESFRRPDYFVSSTDFQSVKFAEAFRIDISRILNLGYPRNRILTSDEASRKNFIITYEPEITLALIEHIKKYDKVFIYMPTWRDSQQDVFSTHFDLEVLERILAKMNALLILKPHPNTLINKDKVAGFRHVVLFSNRMDIYTVLPYTDVLITDYSSVLYDYLLMQGKDVILYVYDYKEYVDKRDFNYSFFEHVAGKLAYSFEELSVCLEQGDYVMDQQDRKQIVELFWGKTTDKDVCTEIIEHVTGVEPDK